MGSFFPWLGFRAKLNRVSCTLLFSAATGCTSLLGAFELVDGPADATQPGLDVSVVPDADVVPREAAPRPEPAPEAAAKLALGASCDMGFHCESGNCVCANGDCSAKVCCVDKACGPCKRCSLSGQCDANAPSGIVETACGPAATDAGLSASDMTCDGNGNCARRLGRACDNKSQCVPASSFGAYCTDGVCCDVATCGTCERCKASDGKSGEGQCSPVPAGTDPKGDCNSGWNCSGDGRCVDKCRCPINNPLGSTPCDNVHDGVAGEPATEDCKSGYYCSSSAPQGGGEPQKCLPRKQWGAGVGCLGNYQCVSGKCVQYKCQ